MSSPHPDGRRAGGPGRSKVFERYWAGAAISSAGTVVTSVAMPMLVIDTLGASELQTSLVRAAELAPYPLLGLVAGAYVDRWSRRRVLVWTGVGRGVVLGLVTIAWLLGAHHLWLLALALFAFGAFSVFGFAAAQSILPSLVPAERVVAANARLDMTESTAQTLGPALAGVLVGVLGAPIAIALDAVSYVLEAALVARLPVDEPPARPPRRLRDEVVEGLRWTYRHPVLAPLAVSTHLWFLAQGVATTCLGLLVLRHLGLGAAGLGTVMTAAGVGSVLGSALAAPAGRHLGCGRAVLVSRILFPLAWAVVAASAVAPHGGWLVTAAMGGVGVAMGLSNANEMGLWQTLTPDELLARVNASRRTVNRTLAAVGALVAGAVMAVGGLWPALVVAVGGFAAAAGLTARGVGAGSAPGQ